MSLTDATGAVLTVGDRIGTITGRQNPVVMTCEVIRIGAAMLTCEVLTAQFTGDPVSPWANRLPKPGDEIRVHGWRSFRLGPCPHEKPDPLRGFPGEELRFDVFRTAAPGNHKVRVRVFHVPTGCQHTEDDYSELEARERAIQTLRKIVDIYKGIR